MYNLISFYAVRPANIAIKLNESESNGDSKSYISKLSSPNKCISV